MSVFGNISTMQVNLSLRLQFIHISFNAHNKSELFVLSIKTQTASQWYVCVSLVVYFQKTSETRHLSSPQE